MHVEIERERDERGNRKGLMGAANTSGSASWVCVAEGKREV